MIKATNLIGRHIVAINSGKQLNKVNDLIFDHSANQLLALLVDEGGWFKAAKVVPYAAVRSLGDNAVMVDSEAAIVSARDDKRINELLSEKKSSLIGTKLLTTDGRDLGRISDVFIEPLSGKVVGYEATGGLFADLSSGRTFVPAPESITVGSDAAIVPPSIVAAMEESEAGGLQGAVNRVTGGLSQGVSGAATGAREAAQSTASDLKAGYQDAAGSLRSSLQQAGQSLKAGYQDVSQGVQKQLETAQQRLSSELEDLQHASRERQVEFVLGKVAGQQVLGDRGEVIVRVGEIITPLTVSHADQGGALLRLVAAAGAGSLKQGTQHLSQEVAQRVDSVQDRLEDLHQPAAAPVHNVQPDRSIQPDVQRLVAAPAVSVPNTTEANTTEARSAAHVTVSPLLGKRVLRDVYAPNHTLVAAQGQIVNADVLARAQATNQQEDLQKATDPAAVSSDIADELGEQLSAGVAGVAAGASQLLGRAKQWLGEKREEAEQALEHQQQDSEQQQIKDALGRPVTRVILDPHDQILLNVGEIVTNKAVAAAREAGVLDILLASVSHAAADINPLDVRPNESGKAALDSQKDS